MTDSPRHSAGPPCAEFERRLVLFVWDELEPSEKATVAAHAEHCPACAAALVRERTLVEQLSSVLPEAPSELLIADCRKALARGLDGADSSARWWKRLQAASRPAVWLIARPAWTVAALVLAGFLAGRISSSRSAAPPYAGETGETESSMPASLDHSAITSLQRLPNGAVAVRLTTEQPMVVQGTVEDGTIRGALVAALDDSRNLDPDARLESVELLRPQRNDAAVRRALCQAALHDTNPGVRLKAVEALRGLEQDVEVRRTLLDVLERDGNPGVRVEAVGSLRTFLEGSPAQDWARDERVVRVLRDRQRKDPNEFVRLQSDAAIRQISSRDIQ
jgi:hypothetical protein